MKKGEFVKLRAIHICDGVIRDSRNLPTVAGIYPARIECVTRPAFLELSLVAAFDSDGKAQHTVEFSVDGPSTKGGGTATIDAKTTYFDMEARVLFFVREDSEIVIRFKIDDGRWSKPQIWKVIFNEDAVDLSDADADVLRKLFRARLVANSAMEEGRQVRPNY